MENNKISFKHICKEDTYMFNYTQLPDELFTIEFFAALSLHAKVLYSFMLRRVSVSKDNNWIDETGDVYIYYRADEIMEKFNCSNKTASKIMAELEEIGLIEKKRQGQGRPDIIYVNKFSAVEAHDIPEEEPDEQIEYPEAAVHVTDTEIMEESAAISEVKKVHFQKCKKYISKNVKNTSLEVKNLHANYKENNYKDIVISSSLSPPDIQNRQALPRDEEEEYKKQIRYHEAEQIYSAKIVKASYDELIKRDKEYRHKFTAEMFAKVCKTIASSKEPIIYLSGFINWCFDNISLSMQKSGIENGNTYSQFNKFMQQDYDFKELENEIVCNLADVEKK